MNFLRIINDWLHLGMAVIWIGGIHYHFVILGATAKELDPGAKGALTLGTFKRFTRIVWASIFVLVITGLFKGMYLRAFVGLFSTTYGWILGIKLLMVLVMILAATLFTFVYGPQFKSLLESSAGEPSSELMNLQKKMSMLVRINLLFGFLILLAVVMLAANR
jgi:uncharacterized membrane protein